jgi:hypothetical protein
MFLKTYLLALLLFAGGFSCRETVSFITGTTYFEANHIRRIPANALSAGQKGFLQFEGVYLPSFEITNLPALLLISPENTMFYVPLNKALQSVPGEYVAVEGEVMEKSGAASSGVEYSIAVLSVGRSQNKWKTQQFLNRASVDYLKGKVAIQQAIALPASKLRLPDSPQWLLVADVPHSRVIAFFASADLMYAAEVNLVYDLVSSRLIEVYADQWFKGE